jgi:aminoglycoside phosphotransferase (APT) family kinase protein
MTELSDPAREASSRAASAPEPAPAPEQAVASRLLDYLRIAFKRPALAYAETPARVTGGFETSIFRFALAGAPEPLGGPLILRLFAQTDDPDRARMEAAIQNAVAELGYPAPRVFVAETDRQILGGAFVIMERMAGRMLTQEFAELGRGRSAYELIGALVRVPAILRELSTIMAAAQSRLHQLPVEPLIRAVESAGLPAKAITFEGRLERIHLTCEEPELAGLRPAVAWLEANRPPPRRLVICHCDFQPFNILVDGGRVTGVIDWTAATIGDPALDLGFTLAQIATAPIEVPVVMQPIFRAIMKAAGRRYCRAYGRGLALDATALRYYQVFACMDQLAWACNGLLHGYESSAFWWGSGIARLVSHIGSLTGIKLNANVIPRVEVPPA